jgi:type I restriction enzyme M protein
MQKLIEAKAVDVMVAVGPNMFYTVTLPCTLWFLDRGKARTSRADTVLSIDARHTYRQIDRSHREWTPAQIGFLANVVRLYRSESLDLTLGGDEARVKLEEIFGKKPKFADVPGLCRAATLKDIEAQGWSLNPGRDVGVAPGEAVSDEDFKEQLETLNEELETLNAQARELEQTIVLEWQPWARASSTESGQIGLLERWQKNALRYLVPETGEIFKVPRSPAVGRR